MIRRWLRRFSIAVAILLSALVGGTLVHEFVGHGLTAVALGGRITRLEVLGLQVYPSLSWIGWQGHYGECGTDLPDNGPRCEVVSLGGSLSTWLVALLATAALWLRRWGPRGRIVLLSFSIWWIDLLTYTLPSWGLRRSILWGQHHYSEPYEAAVSLGVPGPVFQIFAIGGSLALATALALRMRTLNRLEATGLPPRTLPNHRAPR